MMSNEETTDRPLADRWDAEYQKKGIPSSFRSDPSGSLEDVLDLLQDRGFEGHIAIDIGCGTGRNSLYLASRGFTVYSMDFVPRMISSLEQMDRDDRIERRIFPFCQSVTSRWPVTDNSCDLAVDMFCFKHLVRASDREAYIGELVRSLAPAGYYILTLAGLDDGYYGPLPRQLSDLTTPVIIDPKNGIPSALYDRAAVEDLFCSAFAIEHYEHKAKRGLMHESEYQRSTHLFVMKPAQCG